MPDDFETPTEGQGTESDPLTSSTAGKGDQDLLGTEADQSFDIDGSPPDSEEGQRSPFDLMSDSAVMALLETNPQEGMAHLQEKVNKVLRGQNKSYTKKMTALAKERTELQKMATAAQELDRKFTVMQQKYPGEAERFVKLLKGEDVAGVQGSVPVPEPKNVSELMTQVRAAIKEEIGGLKTDYQVDQVTRDHDKYFEQVKDPRLKALGPKVLDFQRANPTLSRKAAIAAVDPDLYTELVNAGKRNRLPGGEPTTGEHLPSKAVKYASFEDAFNASLNKHGRVRE